MPSFAKITDRDAVERFIEAVGTPVQLIARFLGLERVKDTIVGNDMMRGIALTPLDKGGGAGGEGRQGLDGFARALDLAAWAYALCGWLLWVPCSLCCLPPLRFGFVCSGCSG